MNKQSIRKQIDEAKARIERAFKEEDVPPGIKAAVQSLLLVLEIVVPYSLRKRHEKTLAIVGYPHRGTMGPMETEITELEIEIDLVLN